MWPVFDFSVDKADVRNSCTASVLATAEATRDLLQRVKLLRPSDPVSQVCFQI